MGFAFFDRGLRFTRRTGASIEDFVVVRAVKAAPSAFVFYDGSESLVTCRASEKQRVPGGAFFLDEAQSYPDAFAAHAAAERLNAGVNQPGEMWVAMAVRSVLQDTSGFTPAIGLGCTLAASRI